MKSINWSTVVVVFLRLAVGITFLSSVADRFGLWGPPGARGVSWGNFAHFAAFTRELNWFLPTSAVSLVAWLDTIVETIVGVTLITGVLLRASAMVAGVLLLLYALTMTFALGAEAPLNYSVWSASAGAFAIALLAKRSSK
jgi:uncharacterized membrane protein YphA (DoxX/SURF4 family)